MRLCSDQSTRESSNLLALGIQAIGPLPLLCNKIIPQTYVCSLRIFQMLEFSFLSLEEIADLPPLSTIRSPSQIREQHGPQPRPGAR
jgi:hypothetical protein